jgi:hypothetical protein
MLEKPNNNPENLDVCLVFLVFAGQQRGDGVRDAKPVDGGSAAFVHVVEQGIVSYKVWN